MHPTLNAVPVAMSILCHYATLEIAVHTLGLDCSTVCGYTLLKCLCGVMIFVPCRSVSLFMIGDEGDEDDSAEFGDDQEEYKVPVDGAHSDGSEAVEGGSTKASRNSSKTIKDIQVGAPMAARACPT